MHVGMKRVLTASLLIASSLGMVSCDSKSSLTDVEPGESRFLSELDELDFPEAEAPAETPVFRWDFSEKDVVHEYDYMQEVRGKMDPGMGLGEELGDMSMSAKGIMLIRSQGDATAELVIKDVIMTSNQFGSGPREQKVPPMALQGMQENGKGPFGDNSQDMFLKVLFTLPAENMELGQTVEVPMQMPYQIMGSALVVKGQSKVKLTRYVRIGDRLCAQLDVVTDICDLDVPPEIDGEVTCFTTGKSVLFFDVEKRCFVSGTICLLMESASDLPAPMGSDMDVRIKSSVVMDNFIKLRLKESS